MTKFKLLQTKSVLALMLIVVLASCNEVSSNSSIIDSTKVEKYALYFGGDIITMEGDMPEYVESLVQKDGKIVFVGSKSEAKKNHADAIEVNLNGSTLLPGFFDAHSHLTMGADATLQANLSPIPVGNVVNISDIVKELQNLKKTTNANDTAWLIGSGYDQDFLAEKRHPTKEDLDKAFPLNPVILMHASGHMMVANSAAMKVANITSATKNPAGGTIIRKKGSNEPEGLMQEMAMWFFAPYLQKALPIEEEFKKLINIQNYYASCGVTTANEGGASDIKLKLLQDASRENKLFIDVTILPLYAMANELVGTDKIKWKSYFNRLKIQGIKIVSDGSPQGKTAFLSKPYLTPVPGCVHDCRGFPNLTQDEINNLFLLCYKNNVQIFSHCNGDGSTDMMLKAHETATKKLNSASADRRTTIIHSQIVRPDQLSKYKQYAMIPSFFTNHTFFWGDVHRKNLGDERATFISPLKAALDSGIRFTNHTDYTVTPMNQLFLLWTSVNRVTRNNFILGENQRIDAYNGLQALTINAAYQFFEESEKGSLKPGKLADFVILSDNPLKIAPEKIKDIRVKQTIKEGKTIFKKAD